MPPLNPTVAAAPPGDASPQSAARQRRQPLLVKADSDGNTLLVPGEREKHLKSNFTQEINANVVSFPGEESFHLPEPIAETQVAPAEHVSVQDRLKLHCFIRKGDFDIVWPNVVVFAIAHILHFTTLYSILTSSDPRVHYTWIFSKFILVTVSRLRS